MCEYLRNSRVFSMSRLPTTSGALSFLLALPSCSLLIDTHPDGVKDAGSGGTSGEAGANTRLLALFSSAGSPNVVESSMRGVALCRYGQVDRTDVAVTTSWYRQRSEIGLEFIPRDERVRDSESGKRISLLVPLREHCVAPASHEPNGNGEDVVASSSNRLLVGRRERVASAP